MLHKRRGEMKPRDMSLQEIVGFLVERGYPRDYVLYSEPEEVLRLVELELAKIKEEER
jgi:hypothetical protein